MLPDQLKPADFDRYPPEAKTFAVQHLSLLQRMPLPLAALTLREVMAYDWKFPAERHELEEQFSYLSSLSPEQFRHLTAPFTALRMTDQMANIDWVNIPSVFSEQLSAYLWSSGQIEQFRRASTDYVEQIQKAQTSWQVSQPRLVLVRLGAGAPGNTYPLFRKLRAHGTYYTRVDVAGGRELFQRAFEARIAKANPYTHWIVDGGRAPAQTSGTVLDYASLQSARDLLVNKMRAVMAPGGPGPEALRSMMARMTPHDLNMTGSGSEELLNRFRISILTEGSGTQLFSTTFVQWSAREILRRAQPATLLLQYSPRQKEQSMQEMLAGELHRMEFDPQGSLIDADMGAYYTWLNALRLPGAEQLRFLAWYEEGSEVMAIGPKFAKAQQSAERIPLRDLLALTS